MIALAKLAQKRDVRSDIFVSFDDGLLGKPKFFHDVIRVCHFMLSSQPMLHGYRQGHQPLERLARLGFQYRRCAA